MAAGDLSCPRQERFPSQRGKRLSDSEWVVSRLGDFGQELFDSLVPSIAIAGAYQAGKIEF
jgi:hypothetical protein